MDLQIINLACAHIAGRERYHAHHRARAAAGQKVKLLIMFTVWLRNGFSKLVTALLLCLHSPNARLYVYNKLFVTRLDSIFRISNF